MSKKYKKLPIIRRRQNGVTVGFPKDQLQQDLANSWKQRRNVTELYHKANDWEAEHGSLGPEKFTLIRKIMGK